MAALYTKKICEYHSQFRMKSYSQIRLQCINENFMYLQKLDYAELLYYNTNW